jgi:hypothetical protein
MGIGRDRTSPTVRGARAGGLQPRTDTVGVLPHDHARTRAHRWSADGMRLNRKLLRRRSGISGGDCGSTRQKGGDQRVFGWVPWTSPHSGAATRCGLPASRGRAWRRVVARLEPAAGERPFWRPRRRARQVGWAPARVGCAVSAGPRQPSSLDRTISGVRPLVPVASAPRFLADSCCSFIPRCSQSDMPVGITSPSAGRLADDVPDALSGGSRLAARGPESADRHGENQNPV